MVRFIINELITVIGSAIAFTFQYGQIYYQFIVSLNTEASYIYIPIWLDLLSKTNQKKRLGALDLHSNMVRFIIKLMYIKPNTTYGFTFQYGQIYYLPVLVLLINKLRYLHSNMVRFIIQEIITAFTSAIAFTFQYGQIYYFRTCT